jgi:hypothetical protein
MTLTGKGYYIWRIKACEQGDVNRIAQLASAAKLSHVMVKIADGPYLYNIDPETKIDLVAPLVSALKASNVPVWGWQYVYGINPNGEADRAIQRVKSLDLDGYVINAEREYRDLNKKAAALQFMQRLRTNLPDTPIALSSYRFPSLHSHLPWREFLQYCDLNMPQVYWLSAHNPADQLKRCVAEFQKITPYRPVIPTGPLFRAGSWAPSPIEIQAFMQEAQNLNLSGVNFWEWSNVRTYFPDLWKQIADYPWPSSPPRAGITQELISALNSHQSDQVLRLYNPDAVHVTSTHAIQGLNLLRSWYTKYFTNILVNGKFQLVNYSHGGSVYHLSWTADSTSGKVYNGSDTLGMFGGKISYHYTDFSISKN